MNEQRKLLSIDGGGIRGVLALEILASLERELAEALDVPRAEFRLSDFFDYVAGTSTGALIAACLARGMSVAEIMEFYDKDGRRMFDGRLVKILRSLWQTGSRFHTTPLEVKLQEMLGKDTTLEPGHLKCHLLAVTRNHTTDSPWPISSNPAAKYNDLEDPDSNLRIPLWQIVRASAAAPTVYAPELITLGSGKTFMFLDGGVTPYNNPAWLLYRMATEAQYNLNWERGEDKLLLVSVGTGSAPKGDDGKLTNSKFGQNRSLLKNLIGLLIQSTMVDQDTNCRQIGRCVFGDKLDDEIGDMVPRTGDADPEDTYRDRIPLNENLGRQFLYARYNVHLDRENLDKLGLFDIDPRKVRKLSSVRYISELHRIGQRVGESVNVDDFAPFIHR